MSTRATVLTHKCDLSSASPVRDVQTGSKFVSFNRVFRNLALSVAWNTPISRFPAPGSFECYRLDRFQADQIIRMYLSHCKFSGKCNSKDPWAHLILNSREREIWRNLRKPETRRIEWLIGRLVAKDAVRMLLRKHHGMELCPTDIEIAPDKHGCPVPQGNWTQQMDVMPGLSITHTDGIAVAIAGNHVDNRRVGVDIECIRPRGEGFEVLAFIEEERVLLSEFSESVRQEWITRFWCAKEAIAKALGRGLIEGPKSLAVQELNVQTGVVKVALRGKLAEEFPEFADTQITAYTAKEEDYIIASSLAEEG